MFPKDKQLDLATFSKAIEDSINTKYRERGDNLGWRLLYSPRNVLNDARVAFIGLNPGGNHHPSNHSELSMTGGSAYESEAWNGSSPGESALQVQVLRLFSFLGEKPEKVLAGNLVPFRSPTWAALNNAEDAVLFGKKIWAAILNRAQPELIVSMGAEVRNALGEVLEVQNFQVTKLGWGNVSARDAAFVTPQFEGHLVCLPHLSRYKILGRQESNDAIKNLFSSHR